MNSTDRYGDSSHDHNPNPTSPLNVQPRSLNTSRSELGGWRSECTTDVMMPGHYLAIEMNSFRKLAGRRTLNRTFKGIYVDFITLGWNICHRSCSPLFHAFIPKTHLRKKDLSTAPRRDNCPLHKLTAKAIRKRLSNTNEGDDSDNDGYDYDLRYCST